MSPQLAAVPPLDDAWPAAPGWYDNGWPPIPLPWGKKLPPPSGLTGWEGQDWSRDDVVAYTKPGNVAIRCPEGVIGLDVDEHGGESGTASLADLMRLHGPLPTTWATRGRRDIGAGIRWYRVPFGTVLVDEPAPAIDCIQRHHRYAVVSPSRHPTGVTYQTLAPSGDVVDGPMPPPETLPELPAAWVAALSVDAVKADAGLAGAGAGVSSSPFTAPSAMNGSKKDKHTGPIPVSRRDKLLQDYATLLRGKGLYIEDARTLMEKRWLDCEQPAGDKYSLKTALAKLDRAYRKYAPDEMSESAADVSAASQALGGTAYTRSGLAKLPPIEPLVNGLMSRRSSVLVVGPSTVGKTFLMLGVACCVGIGVRWLGRDVEQTRVLYIVGEGAFGLDKRIAAWETAVGPTVTDDRVEFRVKPGSLALEATWAALLAYAIEGGFGLVVIDTLSSTAPDADETKDAAQITRRLSDLAETIDGTAVLVHHTGWGDKDRARGGSQLEANIDEVLVLANGPGDDVDTTTVTRKKVKEGPSGDRLWLKLKKKADSAWFDSTSETDDAVPMRARILQLLADQWNVGGTGPQIAVALGVDDAHRPNVYRVLRQLEGEQLVNATGGRGRQRYFIADTASVTP